MKVKYSTLINILILFCICLCSCSRPNRTEKKADSQNPFPTKYENELFSINMPKGWVYDDTGWKGLDSIQNEVDLYNEYSPVWFHFVKCFMPIQWKNIDEATEMAKATALFNNNNKELIDEIDSVEVGNYPAHILYFANYVDNDTIIQKQFVTYLQDSHIVIYFNENFYVKDWDVAQELGDKIIRTINIKKVKNPLEAKENQKNTINEGMKNGTISNEAIENGKKVMKETP